MAVCSTLRACVVQVSDTQPGFMTPLRAGIAWFDLTCWEGDFFSAFLKDGELLWSCYQMNSPLSIQTLVLEI